MKSQHLLSLLLLTAAAACNGPKQKIIGRWENVETPGFEAVFDANTVSMLGGKQSYEWADAQHIKVASNGLFTFFTGRASSQLFVSKLTNDELTLEDENGDEMRFFRFAERAPTPEALAGTWRVTKSNKSNRCLSTAANKRMQIDRLVFAGEEVTTYFEDGQRFHGDNSYVPEDAWELRGTMTRHGYILASALKGEHRHATDVSRSYWQPKPPRIETDDVAASMNCKAELSLNQLALVDEDGRKTELRRVADAPQKVAKNW